MNLDKMFYLVIDRHNGKLFIPQTPLEAMDRGEVVRDIADGQYNDVMAVIEFNPYERICRDVTEGIIGSVADLWAEADERLTEWKRDLIRDHLAKGE